MNRTKRIENILKKNFLNFRIKIIDNSYLHKGHNNFDGQDETHILIELKKPTNLKVNRLDVHKKINSLLIKEFELGLHSLQINII